MDAARQPGIRIAQIFLENVVFGHREDVLSLPVTTQFQPTLTLDIQAGTTPDDEKGFVRISVQTNPAEKPLYNLTVSMLALLEVDESNKNLSLKEYVLKAGPVMLFPFLREAVAAITWRGRFGPVWMTPFNVSAVMRDVKLVEGEVPSQPAVKRPGGKTKKHRAKASR